MARKAKAAKGGKQVEALTHDEARRKNLPTAELAAVAERVEDWQTLPSQRSGIMAAAHLRTTA
jgi:hypothetical protein